MHLLPNNRAKRLNPLELRNAIGNRIYGCDDCLAACPWNKFAQIASELKLKARPELEAPPLDELVELDETAFRSFSPALLLNELDIQDFSAMF